VAGGTYTLTVSATNGSVTKNPDKASYGSGETVTLQAVPNTGYHFESWTGDLSGTSNPATLTMDADKIVTAIFQEANGPPNDIELSGNTILENQPIGTIVGMFTTTDPTPGDSHAYSLAAGTGSTDNTSFTISGNQLLTAAVFNCETKANYSIRVRSTDAAGSFYEQAFTITVTNVNEAPTAVQLSNSTVAEDQPIGTTVGALSTTDPEDGTFTYSLVAGTGSTDNSSFAISGNSLRTGASFNYEAKNSYNIRVRTTDSGGLWYEQTFTVTVTNVNEAPTAVQLSNSTVAENQPIGTTVGALSTTDPEDGTFTYSLVAGTGSTDNSSFAISGSTLQTAASFNYEVKNSYSLRVRTTDAGGLWYEQTFTITVTPGDVLLRVDSLETMPSGFVAHFNRPVDPSVLNLYDTQASLYGPPDVSIVGQTVGPVFGSLLCHEEGTTVSFVKTGGPLQPDTYTVTLRSAANAFRDSEGRLLDGDADNVEGGPCVAVVTVQPTTARSLSLPDFARGPGQEVNVPATGSGIPVTLSDGTGVLAVSFDLVYSPAILTTTGVSLSSGLPSDWTLAYSLSTPGRVSVMISGPTPLPAGELGLLEIQAAIPEDAPYGSAQILGLSDIQINQGAMAAQSDCGVQVVAYFGDATGNQQYSTLDATCIALVSVRRDSGFAAYPMKDPVVIGDVTGDGGVSTLDAVYVANKAVGFSVPQIPDIPAGLPPLVESGPDPVLTVPLGLSASPGETLTVPVSLDLSDLGPMDLLLAGNIELQYDTDVFDVADADVRLGALLSGWSLVANVDDTTGLARLGFYNIAPPIGTSGTVLEIDFHVRLEAPPGTTTLDFLDSSSLMEGELTLTLTDGEVTITGVNHAPTALQLSNSTVAENQSAGTKVGTLGTTDPDSGDTFTYSLVTGAGSTDNGAFAISGSTLQTAAVFNYEAKNSYSIRVRTTDSGGLWYEQTFTIAVTNVNEPPTAIQLSNSTVAENQPASTTVGTLSTTDPEDGAFTYSLVTGTGSTDNSSFSITGNLLQTAALFNYEVKNSYSIRVRTTDFAGLSYEQTFIITVDHVNVTPVLAVIGNKSINEGQLLTFTAVATDSDLPMNTLTFSLLNAPTGASINSTSGVFSWTPTESQGPGSYNLTVRVTDNGTPNLHAEEAITITVLHISGSPVYRFWSPGSSQHFYTIRAAERDKLIDNYSNVWTYEGVAYYAFTDGSQPEVAPIYRFWSGTLNGHFYTMNAAERDKLINNFSHVWTYEGVAFYAYAEGFQPVGTRAIHRFWSRTLNTHFFTISQTERNKLINLYSDVWTYEGVAWYAYGPETP
jgi:hypothetical protein